MRRPMAVAALVALCAALGFAQESYSGPRPPKKDVPYLLEASKLIPPKLCPLAALRPTGSRCFLHQEPHRRQERPCPNRSFCSPQASCVPTNSHFENWRLGTDTGSSHPAAELLRIKTCVLPYGS